MRASGTVPPGAVEAADNPDLVSLVRSEGPFASVYLCTESEQPDGPRRIDARWRDVAPRLADAGAPAELLARAEEAVLGGDVRTGDAIAAIAAPGVVLREELSEPVRDLATWEPVPRLAPILEARQRRLPHVLVLIDRAGADILAMVGDDVERTEVEGDSFPNERNQPGGWSQARYQRRAISSWEENAAEVAEVVEEVVADIEASFIAVAGDVRAVEMLQKSIQPRLADKIHVITGSRHRDGSEELTADHVQRLLLEEELATNDALIEKLEEELGEHDRAVEGPGAVIRALAQGQVQVLLVHDSPEDERTAWIGPEPMHVASTADDIQAMGVDVAVEARLVDACIRAALGSGAAIRVLPAGSHDIAAVLRWT